MALLVSQTSAARIVRLSKPTDADVARLVSDFGLHPFDAERLLRVPDHSGIERYRDYITLTLVLPWPSPHGLVGIDIRLVLGPKLLVVLGDTPVNSIATALTASQEQETTTLGIFVRAVERVITDSLLAGQSSDQADVWKHNLSLLPELPDALATIGVPVGADEREQIAMIVHRMKHQPRSPVMTPPPTTVQTQHLAVGYVAACVLVLLVTLMFRT